MRMVHTILGAAPRRNSRRKSIEYGRVRTFSVSSCQDFERASPDCRCLAWSRLKPNLGPHSPMVEAETGPVAIMMVFQATEFTLFFFGTYLYRSKLP